MKKIVVLVTILLVSIGLHAALSSSGKVGEEISIEFNAFKKFETPSPEFRQAIELKNASGAVISDTSSASFELTKEDLEKMAGSEPYHLFDITYSSNSFQYPVKFRISMTMLENENNSEDVIGLKSRLSKKYSFRENDDGISWRAGLDEDDFMDKYSKGIEASWGVALTDGYFAFWEEDGNQQLELSFTTNSSEQRGPIEIVEWFIVSYNYRADVILDLQVFTNIDGEYDFDSLNATYRMQVNVTVETVGV